jgi:hypothetical protein
LFWWRSVPTGENSVCSVTHHLLLVSQVLDRKSGKLVGQWTYFHCLATMGQGCDNFPEDDCMEVQKYGAGLPCVLGKECESGGCPWAVPGLTSPEEEPVTPTGQDMAGHGGFCCAAGLGDCNGFGLCAKDTGACHCDEWHDGDNCANWKMPAWLRLIVVSSALFVALGSISWFRCWLRWYLVVHEKPKPPPPPKPEGIRKPPRDSDTETEDEAETTDEEAGDKTQQASLPTAYDVEGPTSIWAKSREKRKAPASKRAADVVMAVAHMKASAHSYPSKDDAIGRPTYTGDANGLSPAATERKPEPPPGPPTTPRTARDRISSGFNANEEHFFSAPQDATSLPLLKQKSSAHIERKQAEKERALRLDKLTGELKEKQVVREGSWEFREGESQTERRIR